MEFAVVKPRENRVPIMMSDAELQAIDDWRFSNRVATRSEAIRRLCQVGLRTLHHLNGIADAAHEATSTSEQISKAWYAKVDEYSAAKTLDMYGREVALLFSEQFPSLELQVYDVHNKVADLAGELNAMFGKQLLPEAVIAADEERAQSIARWNEWASREEQWTTSETKDDKK